jgi:hypothetical protein
MKAIPFILLIVMLAWPALAEDGQLFIRDISKTPDLETDHATMKVLQMNVPTLSATGESISISYYNQDGTVYETRDYAKPLVAFYHDGPVVHPEDAGGFPGHGERDVYGAYSLDDGATWKRTNLSRSADRSSFRLHDGTDYPGDTFRLFAGSAGNRVVVAWASRYANGGNASYTLDDDERAAIAGYVGLEADNLYFLDMWGVAGSQRSSDFADEGYESVGEVPYAALWLARGTLMDTDGDDEYDALIFRQAERLTSGVRDVHRIEVAGVAGAGFVVTWQEDPQGLRPGDGEGPGEGWSGAVAHHETDIWYSWIDWAHFDIVDDAADGLNPIDLADYDLLNDGVPKSYVPFSMPVRLTDNAKCAPIPEYDGDTEPWYGYEIDQNDNGTPDICASTVSLDIDGDGTTDGEYCVTEDGRLMRGNTAATRCRVNLRGYDSTPDDGIDADDAAWVILAYEESKGLGEEEDMDPWDLIEKVDMGKNIWYHTFDMRNPEMVSQGLMLNMPAVYPADGDYSLAPRLVPETWDVGEHTYTFMQIVPDPIYGEQAGLESELYQTEIARRFSLISQPGASAGESGVVAFATWKQGIVRQGGPADVYARRFIKPSYFDPAVDNPFDYSCMECAQWLFVDDGSDPAFVPNPRYVKGLCIAPPKAMSATSVVECDGDGVNVDACIDEFPFNEYFDDIDMSLISDPLQRVLQWSQAGPGYYEDPDEFTPDMTNLDDQSWENPYDVAKGHRGFISGDYIMMLYCWSPNWLANTVGHDNYNLYIRRSFDGGATWSTLPADWALDQVVPDDVTLTADGTSFYEWMGATGEEYKVYFDPAEGEFEPARNVSLLNTSRLTVLDPRYTPTGASILDDNGDAVYPDDERDPSKYFITFEVGDNTTVEFGEATPMDMYYSRALNYGDDYEMVVDEDAGDFENDAYFDWLENKRKFHAAEAALMASPGGELMWAIWNQWQEDEHENAFDSDAMMRRLLFIDESTDDDGSGGGGGGGNPSHNHRPLPVR